LYESITALLRKIGIGWSKEKKKERKMAEELADGVKYTMTD